MDTEEEKDKDVDKAFKSLITTLQMMFPRDLGPFIVAHLVRYYETPRAIVIGALDILPKTIGSQIKRTLDIRLAAGNILILYLCLGQKSAPIPLMIIVAIGVGAMMLCEAYDEPPRMTVDEAALDALVVTTLVFLAELSIALAAKWLKIAWAIPVGGIGLAVLLLIVWRVAYRFAVKPPQIETDSRNWKELWGLVWRADFLFFIAAQSLIAANPRLFPWESHGRDFLLSFLPLAAGIIAFRLQRGTWKEQIQSVSISQPELRELLQKRARLWGCEAHPSRFPIHVVFEVLTLTILLYPFASILQALLSNHISAADVHWAAFGINGVTVGLVSVFWVHLRRINQAAAVVMDREIKRLKEARGRQ